MLLYGLIIFKKLTNLKMKVYPLIIFFLFCLNCSSSDNNSYENSSLVDPDPTDVVQEDVFYITQNIDGSNVSREVLLHLSLIHI